MLSEKCRVALCLVALSLLAAVGCREKTQEETPQSTPPAQSQPQAAPATQAQLQAVGVDLEKAISDLQAHAKNMSGDSLKATALKYKEAIVAKQAEIEKLAAKVKEIPIAQALGDEAKTLKTDLAALETSLKALKERFQIYYDALKEKGADVSALAL